MALRAILFFKDPERFERLLFFLGNILVNVLTFEFL